MRKEGGRISVFNMQQETWTPLPPCPTIEHGLTTLDGELIAVGGKMKNEDVNTVYTLRNTTWTEALPPMPTPRHFLSTASHDNRIIIAAGGTLHLDRKGTTEFSDRVEVYIKESQTWFSANPLPFGVSTFSMSIIRGTCYILGGAAMEDEVKVMLHATISSLLENFFLRSPWQWLQEQHPLCLASPVELKGRLVVMGGSSDVFQRHGTRFISTYDSVNNTWQVCKNAQLPVPLYRAGVVKLDSNQVMIVGGQPMSQQFSAAVYIGSYECHVDHALS